MGGTAMTTDVTEQTEVQRAYYDPSGSQVESREEAFAVPEAISTKVGLTLHNAGVTFQIAAEINLGTYPFVLTGGQITSGICGAPWKITGGFLGDDLRLEAEREGEGSCANSIIVVGEFVQPGAYRGTYGFNGTSSSFRHHHPLSRVTVLVSGESGSPSGLPGTSPATVDGQVQTGVVAEPRVPAPRSQQRAYSDDRLELSPSVGARAGRRVMRCCVRTIAFVAILALAVLGLPAVAHADADGHLRLADLRSAGNGGDRHRHRMDATKIYDGGVPIDISVNYGNGQHVTLAHRIANPAPGRRRQLHRRDPDPRRRPARPAARDLGAERCRQQRGRGLHGQHAGVGAGRHRLRPRSLTSAGRRWTPSDTASPAS